MPTNKELEIEVSKLKEDVAELKEAANSGEPLKTAENDRDIISTLCEIVLELVEVSGPMNQRHRVLSEMAQKLIPHIPKRAG